MSAIIAFAFIALAFSFPARLTYTPSFAAGIDTLLSASEREKKQYLEMRGVVVKSKTSEKGESKLLDSALVNIYDGNRKLLVTFMTNKKGKCDFRLPLNAKFVVEITRKGFVTKFVNVDTKVPDENRAAFIFPFTIDIFEAVTGLDVSILKKPIAKINYSFSTDHFSYDFSYTDRINSELKKMYKNYYFLKTVESEIGADSIQVQPPDTMSKKSPRKH